MKTGTTRERLLDEGRLLVQTKSYAGFAFDELAERVGIRKASIYHHFPDKESFGIEVLKLACAELAEFLDHQLDRPGWQQLSTYIETVGAAIGAGDRVCPGLAMTANWGALPDRVKAGIQALADVHLGGLQAILKRGRADGSIKFQASPPLQAQIIFSSMQGALVLAQTRGDALVYREIMKHVLAQLRA